MLKVPRLWTLQIVNLCKGLAKGRTHVAIYIGSDVVTLGIRTGNPASFNSSNRDQQAKKRLGSRSIASSLTQSLTLSHIYKILQQQNSSASLTIILPAAMFSRIHISAPAALAPQDLQPTLTWALQQQGFAPITDWFWDATALSNEDAHSATYEVLLIKASVIEAYLERLGLARQRLTRLLADTAVPHADSELLCGPWLSDKQARIALSVLETHTRPLKHSSLNEPFNLAHNLVARTTAQYRMSFFQCTTTLCALLVVVAVYGWLVWSTPPGGDLNTVAQTESVPLAAPPIHPIFSHAHIWQQLHSLNGADVTVKRLEFSHNRWSLQIQAYNPTLADAWVRQFSERLNEFSDDTLSHLTNTSWRVVTLASRMDKGFTQIDLEVRQ